MSGLVLRRAVVLVALAGMAVGAAALVFGGDKGYVVYAQFRQAGGLRQGFKVRIDGAPVGKIAKLELDSRDRVVAELRIDDSAAPVGRDAHATARAADLLGEKFVDIDPGDRRRPAPSGSVIPPSRTGISVELDDVINAVDLPTREALHAFVSEQGASYAGRGRDLAALLGALPSSLDRTGELLSQFAQDNRALGRLVDESDRVVAAVAPERASLGRFVAAAGTTLDTLGRRSRELGATVRRAPATLVTARHALAALQGAAIPLAPAARGLRATAPTLIATLNQLPAFTAAARPTLRTMRRVAPTLRRLGRRGTPVVRRLRPLAGELDTFASAFDPVTQTLDTGIGDLLGVLEGWARATQAKDAASHVFRFGATVGPGTLLSLLTAMQEEPTQRHPTDGRSPKAAPPTLPQRLAPQLKTPELRVPHLPKIPQLNPPLPDASGAGDGGLHRLLDYLMGP
jgi:virulence factor Mce-like protein